MISDEIVLPKQESITAKAKRESCMYYYDCPIDYRKPFRHTLGKKAHGQMWGRKPQWRTKRIQSKRSKLKWQRALQESLENEWSNKVSLIPR